MSFFIVRVSFSALTQRAMSITGVVVLAVAVQPKVRLSLLPLYNIVAQQIGGGWNRTPIRYVGQELTAYCGTIVGYLGAECSLHFPSASLSVLS